MAFDEMTATAMREAARLERRVRELEDAGRLLADFAKTAPGRLPARVQGAIVIVQHSLRTDGVQGMSKEQDHG